MPFEKVPPFVPNEYREIIRSLKERVHELYESQASDPENIPAVVAAWKSIAAATMKVGTPFFDDLTDREREEIGALKQVRVNFTEYGEKKSIVIKE